MATRKKSEDNTQKSATLGVKAAGKKVVVVRKVKPVAKKMSKKKVKKASTDKRSLLTASEDKSFWVTNGEVLNNLLQLAECLKQMETRVYKYHTADGRNDFAVWVEQVLLDDDCASFLRQAKTARGACKVVVSHLKNYDI